MSAGLLIRSVEGSIVVQTTGSSKIKSGSSKGTSNVKRELRDYLKVASWGAYGNRGFVVGVNPLKGTRMYSCGKIRKGSAARPILANSAKTEGVELPKKYAKLLDFSTGHTQNIKFNNIFDLMLNLEMFVIAYNKLKSNPGNMTPGILPTTLDGISQDTFRAIISSLKEGSFQFAPGRKVNIPKPNGGTRPLTVAPPRDKIVQEVMRMILEAIFEPTFLESSHGFRPMRSCHTALRTIKGKFAAASFYIEGDISQCFPSIDHHILMDIIAERIGDPRFIQLL